MSNINNILNQISDFDESDLESLSKLINQKVDENVNNSQNQLFKKAKAFFSTGDYFKRSDIDEGRYYCTFIHVPKIICVNGRVDVSFEEGVKVTHVEELNMTSVHQTQCSFSIQNEEDLEMWSNIDDYIFVSSKDLLDDVSKKIKKFIKDKTL